MIVNFVVVHDLHKTQNSAPSLRLQDASLPHDENLTRLTNDILDIYSRKSTKGFGSFQDDTTTYPFSSLLDIFEQNKNAPKFIEFSKSAMRLLESKISTENLATGGYVLFLSYAHENKDYLFMAILRQTKGCVITEELTIDSTQHIQLDKLHTGCQVDIAAWKAGNKDPYITFIKGRGSQTTPVYFLQAIGCAEFTDDRKQTNEIIRAIDEFADKKQLAPDAKREMRQKAHDHCVAEKNVSLDNLASAIFSENPEEFIQHVNAGDYKVSNGFTPDKRVLKKLREVSAQGEGIKLSFPASMIGERVILEDRDGGKVLIIKNPPQKLIDAYEEADS